MSKSDKIIAVIFILASALTTTVILYFAFEHNNTEYVAPPPVVVPKPPETTIFFGGDIMLARNVAGKFYAANDFTLPFKNIGPAIKTADISFANLESPFNDEGDHSVENSLNFNADPLAVAGLTFAGFDILSTANNHTLDQEQKGLDYTIQLLTENKIIPTGTTSSTLPTTEPVIEHNNTLYGFLAYSYTAYNDGGKSTSRYIKDFNNTEGLKQDIIAMKGHTADVVIVSMHAGVEYTRDPNEAQINFAHAAIDAGADLVIGHHPHWIQTVEQYKGKWIFYSLGNLVFDQMWSQDTKEGLTLLITYRENQIKKIELKPVIIEDYCCPRWATERETISILAKINLTSPILFEHN
jgi:hypothetical protein